MKNYFTILILRRTTESLVELSNGLIHNRADQFVVNSIFNETRHFD